MARKYYIDDPVNSGGEVTLLDGEELANAVIWHLNGGERLGADEEPTEFMDESFYTVARLRPGRTATTGAVRWYRIA